MKHYYVLLVFLIAPGLASADARIVSHEGSADDTSTISVKGGKVLLQQTRQPGKELHYDSQSGTLTAVDHGSMTYSVFDEELLGQMQKQVEKMKEMMNMRLAQMPEQERNKALQQLPPQARAMLGGEVPKIDVEMTDEKRSEGGFDCSVVKLLTDGTVTKEACVASAKQLGISSDDFDSLAGLFAALQEMAGRAGGAAADAMPKLDEIGGYPVMTRDLASNKESRVQTVSADKLKDAIFQIPADYTSQEIPGSQ